VEKKYLLILRYYFYVDNDRSAISFANMDAVVYFKMHF
jgi:hypothetical protein